MNKFAAYSESEWKFDLFADTEHQALTRAQMQDETITRVELIHREAA